MRPLVCLFVLPLLFAGVMVAPTGEAQERPKDAALDSRVKAFLEAKQADRGWRDMNIPMQDGQ